MLDQCPILIVEDNFLIAISLESAIEDAGGIVVGPASTTIEALALLDNQEVRAAILDVNLADRDIEPVLSRCVAAGVAIVIHTGESLPAYLAARFPDVVVLTKPRIPDDVVYALANVIKQQSLATAGRPEGVPVRVGDACLQASAACLLSHP